MLSYKSGSTENKKPPTVEDNSDVVKENETVQIPKRPVSLLKIS